MGAVTYRVCSRCKRRLPIRDFAKHTREAGGRRYWCRACEAEYRADTRKKNHHAVQSYNKSYHRKNISSATGLIHHRVRIGYVCELLVAADLNARCGRAYPNPEPQTKDDVYVRTSKGWLSVQVKKVKSNKNTGAMYLPGRKEPIFSDIVAMVDFEGRRVQYLAWHKDLPPEIPDGPVPICSKFVEFASMEEAEKCRSTSTSARAVDASTKK